MKEFVEPEEVYNYLLENNYSDLEGYKYPCLNVQKKIYEWVDSNDEIEIEEDELRRYYHNSIEHIASFFLFKQLDKGRVQV